MRSGEAGGRELSQWFVQGAGSKQTGRQWYRATKDKCDLVLSQLIGLEYSKILGGQKAWTWEERATLCLMNSGLGQMIII